MVLTVDPDLMYSFWPLTLCVGWAVFVLSFVLPDPTVVMVLRVLAFVLIVLAAVFAIPGIA